jgi:hypothetical protein
MFGRVFRLLALATLLVNVAQLIVGIIALGILGYR